MIAVRVFDHFGGGGFAGSPAQMSVRPAADGGGQGEDAPVSLAGTWTYKIERKLKPIVADWGSRPKLLGPDDRTARPSSGTRWWRRSRAYRSRASYGTRARATPSEPHSTAAVPGADPGWRAAWGDARLPFLVQLPNFEGAGPKPAFGEGAWAELREAQALALREPRTAMAVTLDIGDRHDVHPREKHEVGRRLALAALKMVYGRDVIASGPTLTAAIRDSAAIELPLRQRRGRSDDVGRRGAARLRDRRGRPGLEARRGAHRGRVHHHRQERGGHEPVAVRYGWGNNPGVTLRNQADLPAPPFRTDDWATASVTATAK